MTGRLNYWHYIIPIPILHHCTGIGTYTSISGTLVITIAIAATVITRVQKEQVQAKPELSASEKQLTVETVLESEKLYTFYHPRARQIHRLLWEMMAVDNEPSALFTELALQL